VTFEQPLALLSLFRLSQRANITNSPELHGPVPDKQHDYRTDDRANNNRDLIWSQYA
jgi:hypothetical protein